MRRLHVAAGAFGVVIFLLSGQWIRHHHPPMAALDAAMRLMFRSRHIYVLASGLVNLMTGLYMQVRAAGWSRIVQTIGSALLIASTALLTIAFTIEPERGFQPEMRWSSLGLYALFGGAMLHLVSSFGTGGRERLRF